MLIIFSSDAYENITFLGDSALPLLRLMGHPGATAGTIKAEDVAATLSQLKSALENEENKTPSEDKNAKDKKPISLANRAYTLIEMLEAAAKEKCDVTWKNE